MIAFQRARSGDQEKNPSQFDHLSATEVSVILNDTKNPARDVIADFPKHKYVEYKMFTAFTRDYYGLDPLTVSNFVDIVTYKEEFPLYQPECCRYQGKNEICGKCRRSCGSIRFPRQR